MKIPKKEDYTNYYDDGIQPDGYVDALETCAHQLEARNDVLELNNKTVTELNNSLQEELKALKLRYKYR
jgi:hypothetical protein